MFFQIPETQIVLIVAASCCLACALYVVLRLDLRRHNQLTDELKRIEKDIEELRDKVHGDEKR